MPAFFEKDNFDAFKKQAKTETDLYGDLLGSYARDAVPAILNSFAAAAVTNGIMGYTWRPGSARALNYAMLGAFLGSFFATTKANFGCKKNASYDANNPVSDSNKPCTVRSYGDNTVINDTITENKAPFPAYYSDDNTGTKEEFEANRSMYQKYVMVGTALGLAYGMGFGVKNAVVAAIGSAVTSAIALPIIDGVTSTAMGSVGVGE